MHLNANPILCIDCGNSRVKYGLGAAAADDWLTSGALPHAEIGQLPQLLADWPAPRHILLANVAGAAAEEKLRQLLAHTGADWQIIRSTAQAAGVRNTYRQPERLGVDRWCALIGARGLQAGNLLVVMAGTATTIDALDADGNFLGGLILPGQTLMRQTLARATADLPLAAAPPDPHPDAPALWPDNTEDAIFTGTLYAQLGAIERAWAALPDSACLLSGGGSRLLAAHLSRPCRQVAQLPLLGLRRWARLESGWNYAEITAD